MNRAIGIVRPAVRGIALRTTTINVAGIVSRLQSTKKLSTVASIKPSVQILQFQRFVAKSTTGEDISQTIDQIDAETYHKIASEYLEYLAEKLDTFGETYKEVEVDLAEGVMNLDIEGLGSYAINMQPPNKQIWLSSPVSGPNRFDLVGGKWLSLRNGDELGKVLGKEVSEAVGGELEF